MAEVVVGCHAWPNLWPGRVAVDEGKWRSRWAAGGGGGGGGRGVNGGGDSPCAHQLGAPGGGIAVAMCVCVLRPARWGVCWWLAGAGVTVDAGGNWERLREPGPASWSSCAGCCGRAVVRRGERGVGGWRCGGNAGGGDDWWRWTAVCVRDGGDGDGECRVGVQHGWCVVRLHAVVFACLPARSPVP